MWVGCGTYFVAAYTLKNVTIDDHAPWKSNWHNKNISIKICLFKLEISVYLHGVVEIQHQGHLMSIWNESLFIMMSGEVHKLSPSLMKTLPRVLFPFSPYVMLHKPVIQESFTLFTFNIGSCMWLSDTSQGFFSQSWDLETEIILLVLDVLCCVCNVLGVLPIGLKRLQSTAQNKIEWEEMLCTIQGYLCRQQNVPSHSLLLPLLW
jgi:hypothetical protein